jgi:hypothetical protein
MNEIQKDLLDSLEHFVKYKNKIGSGKAFLFFIMPTVLFYGAIIATCLILMKCTGGC